MRTSRLEAFSDGVLAIIITIMVLELKVPEGHTFADLRHSTGKGLLSYLLSFVYVGIYWNNHHHMFQLARRVTGGVLWANLGLLFCLSLFPFTTAWMDETDYARFPVVLFGVNLLAAACAYSVLQGVVIRAHGPDSELRRAVGWDLKGRISPLFYLAGILSAQFVDTHGKVGVIIATGCYTVVALIWIVPDRRIGRAVREFGAPD
ncbi:putative integral membrane protein [Frankia torreyi]|uniref:Putative integral membrane protein n=2 Tax=Frankia TaxID=1854 RepID=A0A0D8BJE8_9ACTN|nr:MULTISPECIES: TMEM175 family protein [Frankia]KJE24373.1 putative integral membrane protein [Frankia torreyi]KQC34921.1 hypothetical protein UK82_29360 [Frankia sp. ACN1ag]